MIDVVEKLCDRNVSIWLNMQPTDDENMEGEHKSFPDQPIMTVGQMSLNAHIAEKLGFTIESDFWYLEVLVKEEDGSEFIETRPIRKVAYKLSKQLAKILENDGELVENGYALQRSCYAAGEPQDKVEDKIKLYSQYENKR